MLRALLLLLALTSAFAASTPAPKPGRPSHLKIQSGTLTTGSGANVQLTDAVIVVPPKEEKSKHTQIASGVAFLTAENLTTLIKDRLSNTELKDFKIETENGDKAKISATKKKIGIPMPISIEGPVTVTPQGELKLAIDSEHVVGIPIKDLADALGMKPKDMVKSKPNKGFRVEKDAIYFDPNEMLGTAKGHVTGAQVTDKGLKLVFGEAKQQKAKR
jgi:hypothetical protein